MAKYLYIDKNGSLEYVAMFLSKDRKALEETVQFMNRVFDLDLWIELDAKLSKDALAALNKLTLNNLLYIKEFADFDSKKSLSKIFDDGLITLEDLIQYNKVVKMLPEPTFDEFYNKKKFYVIDVEKAKESVKKFSTADDLIKDLKNQKNSYCINKPMNREMKIIISVDGKESCIQNISTEIDGIVFSSSKISSEDCAQIENQGELLSFLTSLKEDVKLNLHVDGNRAGIATIQATNKIVKLIGFSKF